VGTCSTPFDCPFVMVRSAVDPVLTPFGAVPGLS